MPGAGGIAAQTHFVTQVKPEGMTFTTGASSQVRAQENGGGLLIRRHSPYSQPKLASPVPRNAGSG